MATRDMMLKLIVKSEAQLPCYLYSNGFTSGSITLYSIYVGTFILIDKHYMMFSLQ